MAELAAPGERQQQRSGAVGALLLAGLGEQQLVDAEGVAERRRQRGADVVRVARGRRRARERAQARGDASRGVMVPGVGSWGSGDRVGNGAASLD